MSQKCCEYYLTENECTIDGVVWKFQLSVVAHFNILNDRTIAAMTARIPQVLTNDDLYSLGRYFLAVISHSKQRTIDCWAAIHGIDAQRPNLAAETILTTFQQSLALEATTATLMDSCTLCIQFQINLEPIMTYHKNHGALKLYTPTL